ncbi:hypothetical protein H0H81_006498 [Sphagnurus paluster]|uniref:Uncharacterized protein n=1 Tax=Sphagnurus paluster TaxID=117069 RepID=A0A9P7FL75_9AGAR|nr:hypothetical protein H0H81_006498 [Sphagnurus paluster]
MFAPLLAILHMLLQRDAKQDICIGILHWNKAEMAAANFATIINNVMPFLEKMASFGAQLDHSNPDTSKFLQLASINNNPQQFKHPKDNNILSLQDKLTHQKARMQ